MTPLEAARRLAADMPARGGSGGRCYYCLGGGKRQFPHDDDCPWAHAPAIIAALEAAEQYLRVGTSQHWHEAALALGLISVLNTDRGRVFVVTTEDGGIVAPAQDTEVTHDPDR